ncbi:MAG TPA: CapA family protein, partial [Chroococcidiopsis sp.]
TDRPHCLLILLEFDRLPDQERLVRFVCHRLCKLNSDAFGSVHILARFLGTSFVIWEQTVRLATGRKQPRRAIERSHERSSASRGRTPASTSWPAQMPGRSPTLNKPVIVGSALLAFVVGSGLNAVSHYILGGSVSGDNMSGSDAKSTKPQAIANAPTANSSTSSSSTGSSSASGSSTGRSSAGSSFTENPAAGSSFTENSSTGSSAAGSSFTTHSPANSSANSSARGTAPTQNGVASTAAPVARTNPVRTNKVQTALEEVAVLQQDVRDPANPIVTLMFSSDAMVETPQADPHPNAASKPITALAENTGGIDPYLRADLAIASIDRPITRAADAAPQPAGTISAATLDHTGVDLVNLAEGPTTGRRPGLAQTLQALDEAGITSVGAGENSRTARRPQIIEVRGQRIAYFGYSDDTLEGNQPSAGINPAVETQVAADIHAIRDQVDWVVVNYHWSKKLSEYPADWQVRLARYAVDQGADLVVGYHPDVLQGAEVYKGRAIAYSLGDFIFSDRATAKENYNTAVLKVSLNDGQMKLEFLPVQVRQSKPSIVDSEKGRVILSYIQQASQVFEQPLTSPMVLDGRAPKPGDAATKTTSPNAIAPANSFITYPETTNPETTNPETGVDAEVGAEVEAEAEVHDSWEESADGSTDESTDYSADYSEEEPTEDPSYADDYADDEWSHDDTGLNDEAGATESDAEY